ncbi:hypothetical protein BKI52_36560 [marine bacterium AO1-C]|nr:hypothetical protein BKI52_36560 [marine bacterium AO1-C]
MIQKTLAIAALLIVLANLQIQAQPAYIQGIGLTIRSPKDAKIKKLTKSRLSYQALGGDMVLDIRKVKKFGARKHADVYKSQTSVDKSVRNKWAKGVFSQIRRMATTRVNGFVKRHKAYVNEAKKVRVTFFYAYKGKNKYIGTIKVKHTIANTIMASSMMDFISLDR